MHQAAKTKRSKMAGILTEGGSRVKSRKVQKLLKRITTCHLPLFSLFLHIVHGLSFGFTFYTHYINIDT